MNERQQRFCDEYLIDCNAVQAAIRAGYSPKTARFAAEWINERSQQKPTSKFNAEMKSYIDAKLEAMHNAKTADAQEVLEYLTSVMRGEHKEQVLKLIGDGIQTISDIDVGAKDRIKAAELIGKRYGMFKDGLAVEVEPVTLVNDLKE